MNRRYQYGQEPGSGPEGKTCEDCFHKVRAPDSQHVCAPVVNRYGWSKTKSIIPDSPACGDFIGSFGSFSKKGKQS